MPHHILILKKKCQLTLKKKKKNKRFWSWHVSFFPFFFFFPLFWSNSEIPNFQNPLPSLTAPHPPNPPLAPAQEIAAPHLFAAPPLHLLAIPPIHQLPSTAPLSSSTAPLSFWVSPSPLSLFISLLSLSDRIFSLEYEYMCVWIWF